MFTFVYIIFFTSNNHTYECTLLFNNRKGSGSFWFRSKEDILQYHSEMWVVFAGWKDVKMLTFHNWYTLERSRTLRDHRVPDSRRQDHRMARCGRMNDYEQGRP